MSPLTYLHYLLISVLILIFIIGTIWALLRSNSKFSILAALTASLIGIGVSMWEVINESVYHVEVSQINDHHLYQTEQLVITGVVTNTGEFPVAQVVGTIKLVNARGGTDKKTRQFGQPTAFAELYKGDNPSFKPQNITSNYIIADYLNPGSSKPFTIILDYPPYFTNGAYEIDASVN